MDEKFKIDSSIAWQLHRVWPAFFEKYGRLTDVQREAIPEILSGNDVLICSPTASGKTEAVCAPLIERNMRLPPSWTILYISPTRALINDLYERLYLPVVDLLGLKIERQTGEYKFDLNNIPNILITTPESFDSLMCRGKKKNGDKHVLSCVNALILDEIHLLYGTPRGEQVKWLIHRLKRLKKQAVREKWCSSEKIQIVGLSATALKPEGIVNKFMPGGKIIKVDGEREIEVVNDDISSIFSLLPKYIGNHRVSQKILVFSNSRKRVDNLTAHFREDLNKYGYLTFAHHSSISKKIREQAEEAMKSNKKVVMFTTSTLEIGIDIGNIDLIILDGPPPSLASLMQRIGRGNRRTGKICVMLCGEAKMDRYLQIAMINAAKKGWLGDTIDGMDACVARQQVASYIFQSPELKRKKTAVEGLVKECAGDDYAKTIVGCMIRNGELIEDRSEVKLGEFWLNKTAMGFIHSNISVDQGYSVFSTYDGSKIASGIKSTSGQGITVAGRYRNIDLIDGHRIEVSNVSKNNFIKGDLKYVTDKGLKDSSRAEAVRRYLGLDDFVWPIVCFNDNIYVFHLGGDIRGIVLQGWGKFKDKKFLFLNEFYGVLSEAEAEKPEWIEYINENEYRIYMDGYVGWFENKLRRNRCGLDLPDDLKIKQVETCLNLENEINNIKQSIWESDISTDKYEFLKGLIQ